MRRERALDELAALHRYLEILADHRFCGGRAKGDDDMRFYRGDLPLEPLMAGVDLALRGRLVEAPLAAQLPFEVLHRVRDIKMLPVDTRRFQAAVEEPSGRPDEGQALLVFLVAGLLAHQHDASMGVAGAEHRLGGVRPQRAVLAGASVFAKLLK